MPSCPLCMYDNPSDASVCEHCGRYRFTGSDQAASSELTIPATQRRGSDMIPRFGASDSSREAMPSLPDLPTVTEKKTWKLVVIRGLKVNAEYPLYDGPNHLGRSGDHPADVDFSGLEPPDQIWASRQHAVIHCTDGALALEDLNSLNGTFINRARAYAGKKYALKSGDVVQIGTVQFKIQNS